MTTPLCPYCRTMIPSLSETKRFAISYQQPATYPQVSVINVNLYINPLDDTYLDSRILRRQMKRLRKLQERERDRLNNQQLSLAYRNSKKEHKREIAEQIQEEKEIFEMDEI